MKHHIIRILLASAFCLLTGTKIAAETIDLGQIGFQLSKSYIYHTDSPSSTNSYGSSSNDVRYHFQVNSPTVFLMHHGGSKLSRTSMYLLRREIGSSNAQYKEICFSDNNLPLLLNPEIKNELLAANALSNDGLSALLGGQATVCMLLERGEYELVCEGVEIGNAPNNGEIHTNLHAHQAGALKEFPINLGKHNTDFTYKSYGYYNVDFTSRLYVYYKLEVETTAQLQIGVSSGHPINVNLYNEREEKISLNLKNGLYEAKLEKGVYLIALGTHNKDVVLDTRISLKVEEQVPPEEDEEDYTPSTDMNYIRTITPRISCDTTDSLSLVSKAHHDISYYDHLGRPVQKVAYKASPARHDLIVHQEYDGLGRNSNQWLPVVRTDTARGSYTSPEIVRNNSRQQYADPTAFSFPVFDGSALNRIIENYGPGEEWQSNGRSKKNSYFINTVADKCRYFGVSGTKETPLLHIAGYYDAGELEVTVIQDEDEHTRYVFTDKTNRIILTRETADGNTLDTYSVYDDYGNLCFVLPPAIDAELSQISQTLLDKYAYQYRYDYRNRCIGKKLPGCDWVEMIYDYGNRLVFTQSGEQRKRREWSFVISDLLNRNVLSGIYHGTVDRSVYEDANIYAIFAPNSAGNLYGYSVQTPEGALTYPLLVFKANYYDSYDYRKSTLGFDASCDYVEDEDYGKRYQSETNKQHCKGLITGSTVYVVDTVERLHSSYYYDYDHNLIQTRSNAIGGKKIVNKAKYNFNGDPVKVCEEYDNSITLKKEYTYDHRGRLTAETHILNDKDTTRFKSDYDEFGRMQTYTRSHKTNVLATDYRFNIRNWITSIDNPHFSQTLNYTNGVGTPYYNGNISSMTWKTDNLVRGYKFSYDGLSRMKDAIYGEGTNLTSNPNRFNEQVTKYDKMGNIQELKRQGQTSASNYGLIDNLTLTYDGNQLKKVTDSATNSAYGNGFDFKDGAGQATEYIHDANGNLTKDLNKKIANIEYNYLDLPRRIQFEDGNVISIQYGANGTKLRTTHVINGITTTTDYCGNVIYENGVPSKLLTGEGYFTLSNAVYHYFLQDHQGNNRVVVSQNGAVEEVNHYYPFGGVLASTSSAQPYKYNGKELDRRNGLDWYNYGARMYDAILGRFVTVDPLAEGSYDVNPYAYCMNNPFNRVDPTGMASHYNWESGRYEDESGNEVSWEMVQQELGIGENNGSKSEQNSNDNSPILPVVNTLATPFGTAASLHAGLRYTEHPFGGGYFRTKKGKYFSMDIFNQPEGTKLARKAKGMVNSVEGAKAASKVARTFGNAVGFITTGISAANYIGNPNMRDAIDTSIGTLSYYFWEVGVLYLKISVSYDTAIMNSKQMEENLKDGVNPMRGTFNFQTGRYEF